MPYSGRTLGGGERGILLVARVVRGDRAIERRELGRAVRGRERERITEERAVQHVAPRREIGVARVVGGGLERVDDALRERRGLRAVQIVLGTTALALLEAMVGPPVF